MKCLRCGSKAVTTRDMSNPTGQTIRDCPDCGLTWNVHDGIERMDVFGEVGGACWCDEEDWISWWPKGTLPIVKDGEALEP
jgi:transcription elongation factor Elf1